MAGRSGPHTNIRTAATYVASNTWYATTAFQMGPQANTILLYCTVAVATAGDIEFYIQHSQDNSTYFDLCTGSESPQVFGPVTVAGADTRGIIIRGLPPLEYVKVYFRCSVGHGSATLGINALSYFDEAGTASADILGDIEIDSAAMEVLLTTIDADTSASHVADLPTEGTTVDVDFDASVASAAVVAAGGVELCATEDCYYVWGATPTATTAAPSQLLPAKVVKRITSPGTKIAAIKLAVAGKLSVTPLT